METSETLETKIAMLEIALDTLSHISQICSEEEKVKISDIMLLILNLRDSNSKAMKDKDDKQWKRPLDLRDSKSKESMTLVEIHIWVTTWTTKYNETMLSQRGSEMEHATNAAEYAYSSVKRFRDMKSALKEKYGDHPIYSLYLNLIYEGVSDEA